VLAAPIAISPHDVFASREQREYHVRPRMQRGGRTLGKTWVIAVLALMCAPPAAAVCQLTAVASLASFDPAGGTPTFPLVPVSPGVPPGGPAINNEGVAERLADVLVHDDGMLPACFAAGNTITLTYNAPATSGPGFDRFDSGGALATTTSATTTPNNTTVAIHVTQAGASGSLLSGSTGAAVRIKNLRVDVSGAATGSQITAVLTTSNGATPAVNSANIGKVARTIDPTKTAVTAGLGMQNADGGLPANSFARFTFGEGFSNAFRVAAAATVAGDIASGPTRVVLDFGNSIPTGVTLTFPGQIVGSGLTLQLPGGTNTVCSGPATCAIVYDTVANAAGAGTVSIRTAAAADSGAIDGSPDIGVHIASVSGAGAVTLHAFFSPAAGPGSGNDDVDAAAVPRYVSNNSSGGLTREIIPPSTFFVVQAPASALAALNPPSLSFADQDVGTSSAAQVVVLTNGGTLPLSIASITSSTADFQVTSGCGSLLAAQESCNIQVAFSPQAGGPRQATLSVVDNAPGSPHAVTLSGTGVAVTPAPVLNALTPATVPAGSAGLQLRVTGANFQPNSVVQWNGTALPTTFGGATTLFAGVAGSLVAEAGVASVTVFTPAPGGGTSNALGFAIGNSPMPAMPLRLYLPHLVSGGGYVTKITVVNLAPAANTVVVNLLTPGGTLARSETRQIPAGGTWRVSTDEATRYDEMQGGWAVVGSQGIVGANLFFEFIPTPGTHQVVNSVGFNDAAPLTEFSFPVEFEPRPADVSIGRTVGLALANTTANANNVTLRLVDANGNVIAFSTVTLPPFGQSALALHLVPEFAAALPAANFVGSVTGSAQGAVAVIAMEDDFGPFSATPVLPGRSR